MYHASLKLLRVDIKWVIVIVFNVTFNNISVISWWSILLVEETGVPGENHQPAVKMLAFVMICFIKTYIAPRGGISKSLPCVPIK